jgi:TIR domain
MRVFISYRREDTASAAGRVYDRLCRLLKKQNVFFDVSAIKAGEDFEKSIVSAIRSSGAALIFIGDKWLAPIQPTNMVRIWEPGDYVRAEVRSALARPILVLPILVAGAQMPKPEQLPEDVRAITTKNALPLRHESFDDDTQNIVAAVLGTTAKERAWEDKGKLWSKFAYTAGGIIAALAITLIVALLHFWLLARPLAASIGGPSTTMILIAAAVLFGGWAGFKYEAWKRRLR